MFMLRMLRVFTLSSLGFCVGAANVGTTLGMHGHNHSAAEAVKSTGFGTAFSRIFTQYDALPQGRDKLSAAGWTRSAGCETALGFTWTLNPQMNDPSLLTLTQPLKLYTNAAGQPSGVGTVITHYMPEKQVKYCTKEPLVTVNAPWHLDVRCYIDVGFRSGDQCSGGLRAESIGDQLVVNPKAAGTPSDESKSIPLTAAAAVAAGWQVGSCFSGMGWHHFFNTAGKKLPMTAGNWRKDDLFPVVAMYYPYTDDKGRAVANGGAFNAIFFASITDQYYYNGNTGGLLDKNQWEPSTLNDFMMCKNLCGACSFDANPAIPAEKSSWATMHMYFNDPASLTCPKNTKCFVPKFVGGWGCCTKSLLNSDAEETVVQTPNMASDGQPWAIVTGGLGLLVGVAVACMLVRKKVGNGLDAREVQISEMNTAT